MAQPRPLAPHPSLSYLDKSRLLAAWFRAPSASSSKAPGSPQARPSRHPRKKTFFLKNMLAIAVKISLKAADDGLRQYRRDYAASIK